MNNVDGVQKMSPDEIKKKREIILGMLGEDFNAPKSTNKKVDGILFEKKIPQSGITKEVVAEAEKKHAEEQKKEWQEELKKNTLVGKNILEELIVDKKKIQSEKGSFAEIEPEKEIIKKQPVKKEVTFTKRKVNSNKVLNKTSTKIRHHVVARIKHSKTFFSFTTIRVKEMLEIFSFVSLVAILALSVIYLSLFLLIVNYGVDNRVFRFLDRCLPVPAIIVDNRLVDYYDYIDLKNKLNGDGVGAKKELIKNVITRKFFRKYGAGDVVANEVINSTGLNRIRKIKTLINKGGDFDQIAGKYGDKRELISLGSDDFSKYEYGDKIKALNMGEVSDVIFDQNGYYLFKCYEKNDSSTSLSYIFVQAKNFDEYVDEAAKNIYYVSFVD